MARKKPEATDPTQSTPPRKAAGSEKSSYLMVLSGPNFSELHRLDEGRTYLVGRKEGVDIRIVEDSISREHCAITPRGPVAEIVDLGSENGTLVDGIRVTKGTIADGGQLAIGIATTIKYAYSDRVEAEYQHKL